MQLSQVEPHTRKDSGIRIRPYTGEWIPAVTEFNRRVRPANAPFELPLTSTPCWLPESGHSKLYQEIFLAVEEDCVRGAYTFKHQDFSIGGRRVEVGMCRMPISEGIVDKNYAMVGVKLVNDAVRRQPLLYALGIGSREATMTRLVLALGWRLNQVVPFFLKVRNGFQFLKNIQYLRTARWRRFALDAAAYCGLGSAAWCAGKLLTRNGNRTVHAEQVAEFGKFADEIWEQCRDRYSMLAVRDASSLNVLYPVEETRFIRLKIIEGNNTIGWALLLDTVMSENKYFGNMRVGSIIDCLAAPEKAGHVTAAAARFLDHRGVDMLLSNQSHPAWRRGLKQAGFIQGPSNFFFVTSPQLTTMLNAVDPGGSRVHLNRGDGDGPIHL